MVELKVKELEKVYKVNDSNFEDFVQEVYGHHYSFTADEEVGNDSQKLFQNISGKIDEYEEEKLKNFKETGHYGFISRVLLEDLCREGHIKAGHYLITVCW